MNKSNARSPYPKSFQEFMRKVNEECERRYGVSIEDLPDIDFRAAYQDRTSIVSTVRRAKRYSGL